MAPWSMTSHGIARWYARSSPRTGIALSEPQYDERYLGFYDPRCFEAALCDAGREADRDLVEDMVARYAKAVEIGLRFFPGVA